MTEERGNALPNGAKVGKYRIEGLLGSGGFGITYLALDTLLNRYVALKECLPVDLAYRRGDMTIGPNSESVVSDLKWALERFLGEAEMLAKFRNRNLVSVIDLFEANGTAYMATEYEEGLDFERWLQALGRAPTEDELRKLLNPLLDGLEKVHELKVLHRDIKPENIYITKSGEPILLDFGSARQSVSNRSRPMTSVVTPGYAPFEQYHEGGAQGPWTDLYGLCATLHRAMTGKPPPEATLRERKDPYVPLAERLKGHYSKTLLSAVDAGLNPDETERPQSVSRWRELAHGSPLVIPVVAEPIQVTPSRGMEYSGFWKRVAAAIIDVVLLYVVVVLVVGLFFSIGMSEDTVEWFVVFVWILFSWIYYALMESSRHQGTLGKMALRVRVTNLTGDRIGFWHATGRHLGKLVSCAIFYIGFIVSAFTPKKQGLYDLMAKTLVIKGS